jgi:hypothetical protein
LPSFILLLRDGLIYPIYLIIYFFYFSIAGTDFIFLSGGGRDSRRRFRLGQP